MTEAQIRAELDGTFRKIDRWFQFVTEHVPLDFMPTHEPRKKGGLIMEDVAPGIPRKKFGERPDAEERALIIRMRREGKSLRAIAAATGRDYGVIGGWLSRWKREGV